MLIIDAFTFCRNKEHQTGKFNLPQLERLRAECVSDEGELSWTLSGEIDQEIAVGYPLLTLQIEFNVQLKCQRCLTPYHFKSASQSYVVLAKDEESADMLDQSLDVEDNVNVDVIVGSKSFDVMALIEDEALLAIPLSPKHEVCPSKEKLDAFAIAKKDSPFASLKSQLSAAKVTVKNSPTKAKLKN